MVKVLYNDETIELDDTLEDGFQELDVIQTDLEDTIQFDVDTFKDILNTKQDLEKTIEIEGMDNE